MLKILGRFAQFLNQGEFRTIEAKKNILYSFVIKFISILINLAIVPLTINYVNTTQYGIWLTISSIVGWISFFDFGFTHGFRNRFTEAIAKNETVLARKYVSTIYAVLIIIFTVLLFISIGLNSVISWSKVLNLNNIYDEELRRVFVVLIVFFCLQLILNTITTLLLADQKVARAALITTIGQFLVLISIYIITKFTHGSLYYLAIVMSGAPCVVFTIVTVKLFKGTYNPFVPSFKYVDFKLTKDLIGLGGKFFIIQLSMLVIFQFTNIILSRIEGPLAVTEYNIAYKYFSIIYMICVIVFTPFWSAFTDAYTKNDFIWMQTVYRKLSNYWYVTILVFAIMLISANYVYYYWLGSDVKISFMVSFFMGLYILVLSRANLYMYLINGTGKVFLQLLVYLLFAIISIPLMVLFCNQWGLVGIIIVPIIVYFFQSIIGHVQIKKIISNNAKGVWVK